MLEIVIPEIEEFNEMTSKVIKYEQRTLHFEHSLLSLSKWEAIWGINFIGNNKLNQEQILSYFRCMCQEEIPNSVMLYILTDQESLNKIREYIDAPACATKVLTKNKGGRSTLVTAEVIYYWLSCLQITFVDLCEHWHINRLLTFIRLCQVENDPKNKRNQDFNQIAKANNDLNRARRGKH